MSATILISILKFGVGVTFSEIKKHLFKPNTTAIDGIAGGYEKLDHLIKELDYKGMLEQPMRKIYYWVDRTKTVVDNLRRENNEAHEQEYKKVIDALASESDGIRFQMFSIYSTVTNVKTPLSSQGLLQFWADSAYKKLSNENNTEYHTDDYIRELDTNIAAVAALLHHGLELSMFISSTTEDAENFRKETEERVESLRNMLYQKFYPPAVRQLKSSYDDPGTFLTNGQWFNLYDAKEPSDRNFLTVHDYWIREISMHTPAGDHSSKVRAFRFVASNPQKLLGPIEMHACWQSRGKMRVLNYDGVPASKRVFAYTNSERGSQTHKILFKLIPVQGERPGVKLIPYLENGTRTKADNLNTWGNVW